MPKSTKERDERRPYGVWTCANGRSVVFNRQYKPLFEKTADGRVRDADRDEWVEHIVDERHFFNDGHTEKQRSLLAFHALKKWRDE